MSSDDAVTPKCPSRAVLAAYLRGKLTAAQAEVVKEHVYACPACGKTVNHFLNFAKKNQTGAVQFARLDDPGAKWKYAAVGFFAAVAIGAAAWVVMRAQQKPAPSPTPVEIPIDAPITEPPPDATSTATPSAPPSTTGETPAPTQSATPTPTAAPNPTPSATPITTPIPTATVTPLAPPGP